MIRSVQACQANSQYRLSGISTVLEQWDAASLSDVLWRLAAFPSDEDQEEAREGRLLTRDGVRDDRDGL